MKPIATSFLTSILLASVMASARATVESPTSEVRQGSSMHSHARKPATPDASPSRKRFDGFDTWPQDHPKLVYRFSRAAATADDPIIISAVGRKLNIFDSSNRVQLQKSWLRTYVPKDYDFLLRSLDRCPSHGAGEFAACDEYVFTDAHGKRHSYYFYLGKWPDPDFMIGTIPDTTCRGPNHGVFTHDVTVDGIYTHTPHPDEKPVCVLEFTVLPGDTDAMKETRAVMRIDDSTVKLHRIRQARTSSGEVSEFTDDKNSLRVVMKATSSAPGDASENQANRKEYVGTLSIMSGNKKITIDITYRHGE